MKRSVAVTLLTVLLFAGCAPVAVPSGAGLPIEGPGGAALASHVTPAGATAPIDPASWALADRLATDAYTPDTTAALVEGLARSGIATYADPSSPAPEQALTGSASPFRLLDFQAHALAVGVWGGATFSGAELDSIVPLPDRLAGMPTTADLLAAYVGSAGSPGGALARALMAGQDLRSPATLRFPAVALVLFASDLATDGGRIAPAERPAPSPSAAFAPAIRLALAPAETVPGIQPATALDSVCSDTSNWISGVIGDLFGALKVATPGNLPGAIISSIWNWLVDAAQAFVTGLIKTVTDAVLGTIRSIAASVAAVAEQVASFLPYAVKVSASHAGSGGATFILGSSPIPGTFTASVSAGDLPDWPAVLKDCAQVAQVSLADFHAKNVALTWGPLEAPADPLLAPIDSATTNGLTDAAGQATWGFLTSRDPGDATGEQLNQVDTMPVAVHRPEIAQARSKLTEALLGFIPGILRPYVAAIFAPYIDGLQARLNTLLDARGSGRAQLVFHGQASPRPSASASPTPSGSCGVTLPAGTYTGKVTFDLTTIIPPGQIDLGELGGDNDHGNGPLTVTVGQDGALGGNFHLSMLMHQVFQGLAIGTTDTTVEEEGAGISGTLCSLTLAFASEISTACQATGHGTCGPLGVITSLAGLVPPLPIGAPTSVADGVLTWTVSTENDADAGFGGLSAEVQSTITVTLSTP